MKNSKTNGFLKNVRSAAEVAVALSIVVLAVAAAYNIAIRITPERYEPGVLLTAASLSLFGLAFLISILALIGWRNINKHIEVAVEAQIKESEDDFLGLLRLSTGLFYGRMCRTMHEDRIDVERKDLLELALHFTRSAYHLLQDSPRKWGAINNLAFYWALDGNPVNGPEALKLAEKLREHHSFTNKPEFLNTYAKVVATYSTYLDDPQRSLREARDMLQEMLGDDAVNEYEKKNARRHLEVLNQALGSAGR